MNARYSTESQTTLQVWLPVESYCMAEAVTMNELRSTLREFECRHSRQGFLARQRKFRHRIAEDIMLRTRMILQTITSPPTRRPRLRAQHSITEDIADHRCSGKKHVVPLE